MHKGIYVQVGCCCKVPSGVYIYSKKKYIKEERDIDYAYRCTLMCMCVYGMGICVCGALLFASLPLCPRLVCVCVLIDISPEIWYDENKKWRLS